MKRSIRIYHRLGFRLGLGVSFTTCLAFVAMGWFMADHERETLTRELTLRVLSETRSLSLAVASPLLRKDPEFGLHPLILKAMNENPDLVDLVVLDSKRNVQGHRDLLQVGKSYPSPQRSTDVPVSLARGEHAWIQDGDIVLTLPIVHHEQAIGSLVARASRGSIEASVAASVRRLAIIAGSGLIATLMLVLLLVTQSLRPLNQLNRGVQRIGAGDLESRVEVSSNNELGLLADLMNSMTQGLRQAQADLVQKERLDRELEIARELQETLLPSHVAVLPNYDIAAHYTPALEVSGDYYDVIPLSDHKLALVAADVSGKGVPGLVVMAMLRVILRGISQAGRRPTDAIALANRMLRPTMGKSMFVTCLYGILDASTHTLEYVSAGHCPPILYGDDSDCEILPAGGKAIGMFPDAIFERSLHPRRVVLSAEQGILFYTDGLVEAMNEAGDQLGTDAVLERLPRRKSTAQGVAQRLLKRVEQHRGRHPATDDLTLLVVRRMGAPVPTPEEVPA